VGRLTEQVTIGGYSGGMSEENVALAQRVYDAFNQRDVPSLLALLAPEIEIHTPEGVQRGLEAVGRSAEQQASQEEHSVPHARVDQVFDAGDRVVVFTTLQVRWKETGEVGFEQPAAAVLTMRAGKVLRWQMLSDRQEALEVAGLGGDPSRGSEPRT
jgi:ketosteroid isomerase-like protein